MPMYEDATLVYNRALRNFKRSITAEQKSLFGKAVMLNAWKQPSTPEQASLFRDQIAHLRSAYVTEGRGFVPGQAVKFKAGRGGNGFPLEVNGDHVEAPGEIKVVGIATLETPDSYIQDSFYPAVGGLMIERVERRTRDASDRIIQAACRDATYFEGESINFAVEQARRIL